MYNVKPLAKSLPSDCNMIKPGRPLGPHDRASRRPSHSREKPDEQALPAPQPPCLVRVPRLNHACAPTPSHTVRPHPGSSHRATPRQQVGQRPSNVRPSLSSKQSQQQPRWRQIRPRTVTWLQPPMHAMGHSCAGTFCVWCSRRAPAMPLSLSTSGHSLVLSAVSSIRSASQCRPRLWGCCAATDARARRVRVSHSLPSLLSLS